MSREAKQIAIQKISSYANDNNFAFLANYENLSSEPLKILKERISIAGMKIMFVKNALLKFALPKIAQETSKDLQGSSLLIFSDNPFAFFSLIKIFKRNLAEFPEIKINYVFGLSKKAVLSAQHIKSMSSFASEGALKATLLRTLNAPVTKLILALQKVIELRS